MAVSTQIIQDNDRYAVLKFTNDGSTDESAAAVVKVDASALSGAPTNVKIRKITADVMNTSQTVFIYYDGSTADALAWVANSHTDVKDFSEVGPLPNNATGRTGDISFKTTANGTIYTIMLEVVKGS